MLPTDRTMYTHVGYMYTCMILELLLKKLLLFKDFNWIEADESQLQMHEPKLTPLKGMSSPVFKVSILQ